MKVYDDVMRLLQEYHTYVGEDMLHDDAVREGEQEVIKDYENTLSEIQDVVERFAKVMPRPEPFEGYNEAKKQCDRGGY